MTVDSYVFTLLFKQKLTEEHMLRGQDLLRVMGEDLSFQLTVVLAHSLSRNRVAEVLTRLEKFYREKLSVKGFDPKSSSPDKVVLSVMAREELEALARELAPRHYVSQ